MPTLAEIESHAIADAIERNNGHIVRASKELGIGRTTIYRKIKQHKIKSKKPTTVADAMGALLVAVREAHEELSQRYDFDQDRDITPREIPFEGAGVLINKLAAAIALAERV